MATNYILKPFRFNLTDLNFIRDQIKFRPLFDAEGNAIVNWDGTGTVYNDYGVAYTDLGNSVDNLAAYGSSYSSLTDLSGLRDVSGANNNLLLVNKFWGAVDQPFLRSVAPDFDAYVKPLATGDAGAFYAEKPFDPSIVSGNTDYTTNQAHPGQSVVDYTPRMISQLVTTGGSTPLLDGNGQVVHWNLSQYNASPVADAGAYKALIDSVSVGGAGLIEGATVIENYGILAGGQHDPQDPTNGEVFYGAINPGVAPGNSFLAYFGQFFDHGLDFVGKGAAGTKITIPLATDDPLYRAPGTNGAGDLGNTKITVSRADVSGFDANGNAQWVNHTSPYIDQSQTYGSHAQMTSLLREWVSTDGGTSFHAGADLLDGITSAAWTNAWGETTTATLPTLGELNAHLIATGRDPLTWDDVLDLRNRDLNGDVAVGAEAGTSGQALLLDMNPHFDTTHLSPATVLALAAIGIVPDINGNFALGGPNSLGTIINFATFGPMAGGTQQATDLAKSVLFDSVSDHYIAGDGRANENIALTTIHHVFHEEHNFQVRNIQEAILAQEERAVALGDTSHTIAHEWQVATAFTDASGNYLLSAGGAIAWDEGKLFDAAKLTVEMEYQHAAVDQYARTITPDIAEFVGYNSGENSTVSLEYAQGAFRFGHSTMRETIDMLDPNGSITGKVMSVALEQAFLNPALFAEKGAASIALGLTHQQMNEIDELLTPAMNTGLLGQPLDLAAINIARGRDIGLPALNDFREAIGLTRYISWSDFGANMVHPESLVNFIAAYSFDGDAAKAAAIIGLENGEITEGDLAAEGFTAQEAIDFMSGSDLGFNKIDTWLGGIAEVHVMGGLLGETFNAVFVDQISRLMDGDRFYYLYRLSNLNMGDEIANAQLKDIVERNTGVEHLNGSVFAYADQYIDLAAKVDTVTTTDTGNYKDDHKYGQLLEDRANASLPDIGVYSTRGTSTASNGTLITIGGVQYIRDIRAENLNLPNVGDGTALDGMPTTGADANEVLVATDNNDLLYMLAGDDTAYAEGGNDIIYGGGGIDRLYGGDGNDTIYGGDSGDLIDGGAGDDVLWGESSGTAAAGLDQIIGGEGNDIIHGGIGIDKISGGAGDDVIFGEGETDAFTHGGDGSDYLDGGSGGDLLWGDGGDDLIVGGNDQDIVAGLSGDDILRPGNPSSAMGVGPDEVMGGSATDDLGNDDRGHGFDLVDLSDYAASPTGATVRFSTQQNPAGAIDVAAPFAWVGVEGAIGSRNNDTITADSTLAAAPVGLLDTWTDDNWLIGGSGNDLLSGGLGNDVIIGDGIRLDSLIGTYRGTYTNDFDGASHRAFGLTSAAEDRVIGSNGLLDVLGFDKHFTNLLQSDMYKNLELGGSTIGTLNGVAGTRTGDGGVAGTSDTVAFSGNRSDYTVTSFDFVTANQGTIKAFKVVDNRDPLAVDANGVLIPTDGTDVVVGVENFKFADVTLTVDPPVLDLHAFNVSNYRDQFNFPPTYTGSNGTALWSTSWTETGDVTTGNIVTGGQIRINNGANVLEFGDNDNDAGPGNATIQRTLDLSGVGIGGTARLSFSYAENGFDNGEAVTVAFSADGVTFTTLQTINGSSNSGTSDFALTGPFTANAAVRFTVSGTNNNNGNDIVRIDNVNISYSVPVVDGNNYSTTFTENGQAVAIANNPGVTDGTGTTLYSAKIVLTNAQASDVLSISGLNGTGITSSISNVAGVITMNLMGAASLAAYQAAIGAVRFSNTSDNPDTQPRLIEVTVNDGLSDSNVATTTVTVTSVEDVMVANNDRVVTNYGANEAFAVKEWAFLSNDTDPDSLLDITAISNTNSLTASLGTNPGAITITDTGFFSGGSFTYAGTGADTAVVDVVRDINGSIDGGNSNDIIVGNAANSTLVGNGGRDILVGGAGNDTFDYNALSDVTTFNFTNANANAQANAINSTLERITDFQSGDKIDLSGIDARTGGGNGGDQAFTWLGTGAITNSNSNGGLHYFYDQANDVTVVESSNDGDTAAEFQVVLTGNVTLNQSDFVL